MGHVNTPFDRDALFADIRAACVKHGVDTVAFTARQIGNDDPFSVFWWPTGLAVGERRRNAADLHFDLGIMMRNLVHQIGFTSDVAAPKALQFLAPTDESSSAPEIPVAEKVQEG